MPSPYINAYMLLLSPPKIKASSSTRQDRLYDRSNVFHMIRNGMIGVSKVWIIKIKSVILLSSPETQLAETWHNLQHPIEAVGRISDSRIPAQLVVDVEEVENTRGDDHASGWDLGLQRLIHEGWFE